MVAFEREEILFPGETQNCSLSPRPPQHCQQQQSAMSHPLQPRPAGGNEGEFAFEQETSQKLQLWSKMKIIKTNCYRAILIDSESKRDAEFDYDGVSKRDGDVER